MTNRGLFNPKNAAPDTGGGFREGMIEIVRSFCAVDQPEPARKDTETMKAGEQGPPNTCVIWECHHLDEETHRPILDENESPKILRLKFGLGGKALLLGVHPGNVSEPGADDIEDLGPEVGTEGNTVYVPEPKDGEKPWQLHSKSSWMVMANSLIKCQFNEEVLDRTFLPDFEGCKFLIRTEHVPTDEIGKDGKPRTIPYKIVSKIISASYEKKGKAAGTATTAKPASAGKGKPTPPAKTPAAALAKTKTASAPPAPAPSAAATSNGSGEVDVLLLQALQAISDREDEGTVLSVKALRSKVDTILKTDLGMTPAQSMAALGVLRTTQFLAENAASCDMELSEDGNTVTIGKSA